MNQHKYLRAYMAGIVAPTIFLLVVVMGFTILRYVYNVPVPIERVIVFPMAVVPNIWASGMFSMWRGALACIFPLASMAPCCHSCSRRSALFSQVS